MHNNVISDIIVGQNPQFAAIPFGFIFFNVKSLFLIIKEITNIINEYKISIKIVFRINIIIYFIVPKRVSIDEPSLVQKIKPNITFIIFVVIKTEDIRRQT